jgi:primosomal protein N' (replication factor Y)
MADEIFVDVHFTRPPFGPFTYICAAPPAPGSRVEVELGNRLAVGLTGRLVSPPPSRLKAKALSRVVDVLPLLPPFNFELLEYVAARYASSLGEAARLALPVPLEPDPDDLLILTAAFAARPALQSLDDDERTLAGQIWEAGWLSTRAAGESDAVRRLVEKGIVAVEPYAARPAFPDLLAFEVEGRGGRTGEVGRALRAELAEGPRAAGPYFDNPRKREALRRLLRGRQAVVGLASGEENPATVAPSATLVTGGDESRRLMEALAAARGSGAAGVLVLVPEQYRVPEARRRAEQSWGKAFEPYYSEMSPAARWEVFRRCRRGTVRRVAGTRSALFLPLAPGTAVVVTAEADNAYKQWEMAPYYHGRVVAAARAARAPLVTTAAAPSLEAYALTRTAGTALVRLEEEAFRPDLTVVDMSKAVAAEGAVILSSALAAALRTTLASGGRAFVMVNRRGYIPYIYCEACGASLRCGLCDVAFTYHEDEKVLLCHYCLRREPLPRRCPYCGKEKLSGVGFGTEKLAAEVRLLLGGARVARVDSDALQTPARVRAFWEDFASGAYDVLVGTQMALRALGDPCLTLAALANADTAMNLPDFRATEQTFRTIRRMLEPSPAPRRVIIQTFEPRHYALAAAAAGDYERFAERELAFRRRLNLPPYSRLVNVVVTEQRGRGGEKAVREVAAALARIFGDEAEILGPVPAPLARVRGRRRWQILVKAAAAEGEGAAVRTGGGLAALVSRKGPVRVRVDVDPYDFF